MPLKTLELLGLKPKEAALYEALLPLGDVPLADVTAILGEHPQIVYRIVDSLSARGLAIVTTRKHRKYVRAEDPRILERIEEQKLQELRSAMPDLAALQKKSADAMVRVARGNEAVRALRAEGIDALKQHETYYIIGGSGDRFYEAMGQKNEEVEKRRIQKKINKKLVTFESQRKLLEKREGRMQFTAFRYLPDTFSIPSSTNIFNNTVAILIWTEEPIVITIESAEVAESHRHYFTSLWGMAKS